MITIKYDPITGFYHVMDKYVVAGIHATKKNAKIQADAMRRVRRKHTLRKSAKKKGK